MSKGNDNISVALLLEQYPVVTDSSSPKARFIDDRLNVEMLKPSLLNHR